MSYLGRIDRWLSPTEGVATALLYAIAIAAILVAIYGGPTLKAATAAWMILP